MKQEEIDKLFADAEAKTTEIEQKVSSKRERDERLLNCNKSKVVLFRMFRDTHNNILNLPYKYHSFKSPVTSRNVPIGVSPTLWGEEDYVTKFQQDLYNNGQNDLAKLLYPTERSRVNIFVLSDSSNDNGPEFKVWDYSAKPPLPDRPKTGSPFPKFLKKLKDDPENDVTLRNLFSLDSSGATIKMTIEKGDDDWPEISFEIYRGKKDKYFEKITPEKAEKIYKEKSVDLLDMMEKPKSNEEIDKLLKSQLLGVSSSNTSSGVQLTFDDDEDDDDIPMDSVEEESNDTSEKKSNDTSEDDMDAEFESIMAEFESDD